MLSNGGVVVVLLSCGLKCFSGLRSLTHLLAVILLLRIFNHHHLHPPQNHPRDDIMTEEQSSTTAAAAHDVTHSVTVAEVWQSFILCSSSADNLIFFFADR